MSLRHRSKRSSLGIPAGECKAGTIGIGTVNTDSREPRPAENDGLERRAAGDIPPSGASRDGLLYLFVTTSFLLFALLIWQRTYEQSCWALASPALVYIAVFYGLLEYRLERKRFALDYYLDRRSSWRRRLQGPWLPVLISMVAALPLAIFLAVFAALSRYTDWLFLASATIVAPFLFVGLSIWPGRHFRRDTGEGSRGVAVAEILTARLAGWVLLALIALSYVYINYRMIAGPAYIYPDSLQLTVEAFTAPVRSACPVVEDGLRVAAGIEGVSWYLVTSAAIAPWLPDGIKVVVWVGFFLNIALVIIGFARGLEGSILAAWRIIGRTRKGVTDVE